MILLVNPIVKQALTLMDDINELLNIQVIRSMLYSPNLSPLVAALAAYFKHYYNHASYLE